MVDNFQFFPHTCIIFRGAIVDNVTGIKVPNKIFSCRCYLSQGITSFNGGWLQGEDTIMLEDSKINIRANDEIEITLENGSLYKARIKQAYPISDSEIGGQDLKLFQRDEK
ncbi:MAG: hypothetical protein RRY36_09620 [Bacteroidaceae bacterium]